MLVLAIRIFACLWQLCQRKVIITVGNFEVAVVKENAAGGLNNWLVENEYQTLDDADDVLTLYRDKGYVFACIKVNDSSEETGRRELHPLRFEFKTGGKDAIYFPMKMTKGQRLSFTLYLL